jgi:hypothetical protein
MSKLPPWTQQCNKGSNIGSKIDEKASLAWPSGSSVRVTSKKKQRQGTPVQAGQGVGVEAATDRPLRTTKLGTAVNTR